MALHHPVKKFFAIAKQVAVWVGEKESGEAVPWKRSHHGRITSLVRVCVCSCFAYFTSRVGNFQFVCAVHSTSWGVPFQQWWCSLCEPHPRLHTRLSWTLGAGTVSQRCLGRCENGAPLSGDGSSLDAAATPHAPCPEGLSLNSDKNKHLPRSAIKWLQLIFLHYWRSFRGEGPAWRWAATIQIRAETPVQAVCRSYKRSFGGNLGPVQVARVYLEVVGFSHDLVELS